MSSRAIESVEFDKYFRVFEDLLPNALAVGVCNSQGIQFRSGHPGAENVLTAAVEKLAEINPDWSLLEDNCVRHEFDGSVAYQLRVTDAAGNTAGNVLIVVSATDAELQAERFAPIIECIGMELALTSELDSMTAELTERYEELNLVYHTEDQVNYFREGRDALRQLVENCSEYLGVSITALIMKSKRITIVENSKARPIQNDHLVVEKLKNELYDWVVETKEVIVINSVTDALVTTLIRGVANKILCCPVFDGSGNVAGVLVIANDFSQPDFTNSDKNLLTVMARKAGKIIQANYDALTGLVNRGGFEYFLAATLTEARESTTTHCILYINIDQLRVVNDTAGHHVGDDVIRRVVSTVSAHLRESDTMARIDGDHFGVLLQNCSVEHADRAANQIRHAVENLVVRAEEREHRVTVSIGIAMFGAETDSATSSLAGAELACNESGEQGGNRVETYHDENTQLVNRRKQMALVEKIQSAINNDSFELYSQVIEPLQSKDERIHYEILLRMIENGTVISPAEFLPAAERYHLMPAIDRWVVTRAFEMLGGLPQAVIESCIFAVNLSGQSLGDLGFLDFLHNSVEQCPLPKDSICFEITETTAVRNLEHATHFMTSLGALGCQFSLDDFGVGLSSFSYLKTLPVDHLKIDGSFVKDIMDDQISAAMVAAINQIGQTMGLKTIAEFVENDAIRSQLTLMGIDYAQGYGVGKPMPLEQQLRLLNPGRTAASL